MKDTTDVLIVGGGIVGFSLAYALRKRGVEVTVLDQDEGGMQASRAASGLLAPLKPFAKLEDPYTQLLLFCLTLLPGLVHELEMLTGIEIEYEPTGTMRMRPRKELPRLAAWSAAWRQAGFPVEVLTDDDDIRRLEPAVEIGTTVAVYRPNEPQVNAVQLMQAWMRAAIMAGAAFSPHQTVTAVDHLGRRIQGVRTAEGHAIACRHFVLATGAWAALGGQRLGVAIPVHPVRGQSLLMSQPNPSIRHMLFGQGIYLAPKRNGTLIIGTVRDEAGFDTATTPEGIAWLYDRAAQLVPALSGYSVEHAWAGLLPVTPDARPILGPVSSWDNVTFACGHNGYGLLLAAAADLLAEHIVTGQSASQLGPFLLERFQSLS
jgi:glycine oxidase